MNAKKSILNLHSAFRQSHPLLFRFVFSFFPSSRLLSKFRIFGKSFDTFFGIKLELLRASITFSTRIVRIEGVAKVTSHTRMFSIKD